MAYTEDQFRAALNTAYTGDYFDQFKTPMHYSRCWRVYKAAFDVKLEVLVIGRVTALGNEVMKNFGTVDAADLDAIGVEPASGSVLRDHGWSILLNDAFLLGGVHALHQFRVASPRIGDNLYNSTKCEMTVMGRELVGLKTFGYEPVREQSGAGEAFIPKKPELALNATFEAYQKAVVQAELKFEWTKLVA
jgi:hypothetical protein